VLPWIWGLTQSFETLATTYKTIRLNSPEYITPSSHRPKDLKCVKKVLFLYERSSVYTPTHGLARASRLFVPLSTDTRNENAKWCTATANGPILNPVALQHRTRKNPQTTKNAGFPELVRSLSQSTMAFQWRYVNIQLTYIGTEWLTYVYGHQRWCRTFGPNRRRKGGTRIIF
jgi:hypothetical protein